LRFFVAGIMQGSRRDEDICAQDYRTMIREIILRQYPDAQVVCPFELYPDSVGYGYEEGKRTFLELAERATAADILVAYLPEASMGTAIEMWQAYGAEARIFTISPMSDNWVVKFLSHRVFDSIEGFADFLAHDGLDGYGPADRPPRPVEGAGLPKMALPDQQLEERIGEILTRRGLTLAVAESCTGGLLGHRITNVSGSSAYFQGGVISYSNEAKERILGVAHEILVQHGAVSEETALAMATGARRLLDTDIAVSVTGIAGPTGGTPDKPVGLVYIGLAAEGVEVCQRHIWQGDRSHNKERSAQAALELLLTHLEG
jgi:nicotinamide-nucleotide amidase